MKHKILLLTFILFISFSLISIGYFNNKNNELKDVINEKTFDSLLAIKIDGEDSKNFPNEGYYNTYVTCNNAKAEVSWENDKWNLNVYQITNSNTTCNVDFKLNFKGKILTDNEISEPLTTPGLVKSGDDEAVLASTEDDYGTSYYFRGAVKNNYVEYAGMCWKIVRITGDNSVKLVLYNFNGYNDSDGDNTTSGHEQENNYKYKTPCSDVPEVSDDVINNSTLIDSQIKYQTINARKTARAFARYSGMLAVTDYNSVNTTDNAYIGFMYGTPSSSSFANTHANSTKSTILNSLEQWYRNVLSKNPGFSDEDLADTIWCNDKSISSGSGIGMAITNYGAHSRLYNKNSAAPSLKCPSTNSSTPNLSKFTVSDNVNGNGNLSYKIGLLTADEVTFAGLVNATSSELSSGTTIYNSTTNYLIEGAKRKWWTMTPRNLYNNNGTYTMNIWTVASVATGDEQGIRLSYSNVDIEDEERPLLRPAITLVKTTEVTGSGTSTDPYKIK